MISNNLYNFTYTGGITNGVTYLWDFGINAVPAFSTDANPTGITYSSSGQKEVTLTVTRYGCSDVISKHIDIQDVSCGNNKITICHIPSGNSGNPQTICISESALSAHLAHGDCVGDCGIVAKKEKQSISIQPFENLFTVYPNPFKEKTTINFAVDKNDNVTIDIYNYIGVHIKRIYDNKAEKHQQYNVEWDTDNLPNGVYYGILKTSDGQRVIKLALIR